MFSIRFVETTHPPRNPNAHTAWAEIVIGQFREEFEVPLSYWSRSQYLTQWRESASRMANGSDFEYCVATAADLRCANFVLLWLFYGHGIEVLVQNRLLMINEALVTMRVDDLHSVLRQYQDRTDDGNPISQWKTSREAMRAFAADPIAC